MFCKRKHWTLSLTNPSIDDNMQLREVITQDENESHTQVKKLLRKYEKFRVNINNNYYPQY